MKKTIVLLTIGLAAASFTACNNDDDDKTGPVTGTENGHAWVDLGLPSGTKWATCNIGADTTYDCGTYFAWGETTAQAAQAYNWTSYKWCDGTEKSLTKYCGDSSYGTVDNKSTLEAADDAVIANWGGNWVMPTESQFEELAFNTHREWTADYNGTGVSGFIFYKVKKSNSYSLSDAHIFMRAAGWWKNGTAFVDGVNGLYWSSSVSLDAFASGFNFNSTGTCSITGNERCEGFPVRAVINK